MKVKVEWSLEVSELYQATIEIPDDVLTDYAQGQPITKRIVEEFLDENKYDILPDEENDDTHMGDGNSSFDRDIESVEVYG